MVVLCHGYGASGQDLVGLADAFLPSTQPTLRVRFVFPQAPLDLSSLHMPGARAWWHLNPALLQARADDPAAFAKHLRAHVWEGLPAARKLLHQAIDQALQQSGLTFDRLVLGGFSQGAMLTTDLTLRLEEPPAGLVILSGSMLDEARWEQLAAKRAGLRVVQSHGRADPILPYSNAEVLRDMLLRQGCAVQFAAFDGGHSIPHAAHALSAQLIADVAKSSPHG